MSHAETLLKVAKSLGVSLQKVGAPLPTKFVPRFGDLVKGLVSRPKSTAAASSALTPRRAAGLLWEHHPGKTIAGGVGTALFAKHMLGGGRNKTTNVTHY